MSNFKLLITLLLASANDFQEESNKIPSIVSLHPCLEYNYLKSQKEMKSYEINQFEETQLNLKIKNQFEKCLEICLEDEKIDECLKFNNRNDDL